MKGCCTHAAALIRLGDGRCRPTRCSGRVEVYKACHVQLALLRLPDSRFHVCP